MRPCRHASHTCSAWSVCMRCEVRLLRLVCARLSASCDAQRMLTNTAKGCWWCETVTALTSACCGCSCAAPQRRRVLPVVCVLTTALFVRLAAVVFLPLLPRAACAALAARCVWRMLPGMTASCAPAACAAICDARIAAAAAAAMLDAAGAAATAAAAGGGPSRTGAAYTPAGLPRSTPAAPTAASPRTTDADSTGTSAAAAAAKLCCSYRLLWEGVGYSAWPGQ